MNILMFNYAKQLFDDERQSVGEERVRMRDYAKFLDQLFIAVHTPKRNHFRRTQLLDNLTLIPSRGWNRASSFFNLLCIGSRLCSRRKIDIVSVQEPYYMGLIGIYLKKRFGCKLITGVLGANVYERAWIREAMINRLKSAVGRWVLKHSDFVQVDGSRTKTDLMEKGIPERKIFRKPIVPEGLEKFSGGDGKVLRAELLDDACGKLLLFVGRIERQKNLDGLLKIMPDILKVNPKVRLVVIGEGREKASLQKMAENLGLGMHVLFTGNVPFAKLPEYFAASDIFLSSSNYEGFARTLMEAGFAGKPIVSTDVSGASDIIEDGESGFIVPVGAMDDFRDRVIRLLQDEDTARRFGVRVRQKAATLSSYEEMVQTQIQFWRRVSSGQQDG